MGSQLRWLERTPDKREVGGSSPLEPTNFVYFTFFCSPRIDIRLAHKENANQNKIHFDKVSFNVVGKTNEEKANLIRNERKD